MGWYTDFFIADPADAEAIATDAEEDAFERWPHLGLKHVGDLELGALLAAVRGQVANEHLKVSGTLFYPAEYEVGYEGPLIYELAPDFVNEVAALTAEDQERIAVAWAGTEEMAEWSPDTVRTVLEELTAFARRSVADHKPVLQMFVL